MQIVNSIDDLRALVHKRRSLGQKIAFVPTMGNLHNGHLSLITRAKQLADCVVVSIFVNPLQFGPTEDFSSYPRTLQNDRDALKNEHVDILFLPDEKEIYPEGKKAVTKIIVPDIGDILCGASRPGFFTGVATVVCKLLNMVQADIAVFGEKDFQQLLVIKRLVKDLNMPVHIESAAIVRETSGLAMSSRNHYLSKEQRVTAATLHQSLQNAAAQLLSGATDIAMLEQAQAAFLSENGFIPDYFSVRRRADLQPAKLTNKPGDKQLIILAAAYLADVRLIDNVMVDLLH